MANLVEITVKTVDKTDFDGIERKAKTTGSGIGTTFRSAGATAGAMLVTELTSKLTEFASRGFQWVMAGADLASAFNESLSKVNTIFGESANVIEDWSRGTADAIGLSAGAALDAAGTFGNLFDQLGFASSATADMSIAMVNLAADFASFHNAQTPEVIEAMTAAFRGEYDALQRFVPTINAAAVEQQAMAMTGKENAKALTAQEKAAAVYTFVLENAGQAAGDFARTADGTANAQRRASAAMEDFQTNLGQRLIPVLDAVAAAQTKMAEVGEQYLIPALDRIGQFISDHRSQFEALGNVITDVASVIGTALAGALDSIDMSAVDLLATAIGITLVSAAALLAAAFAGVAAAMAPFVLTIMGIASLIGSTKELFTDLSDAVRDLGEEIPAVGSALDMIGGVLGTIGDIAGSAWDLMVDGLSRVADKGTVASAAVDLVRERMSIIPDVLSRVERMDEPFDLLEGAAGDAAAGVDGATAALERLEAQIKALVDQYTGSEILRKIEEQAANLADTVGDLTGDVYDVTAGFDRADEQGSALEAQFEDIHKSVLQLAQGFLDGTVSADELVAGQARAQRAVAATAGEMRATETETRALISQYAAVPDEILTQAQLQGAHQAGVAVDRLHSQLDRLDGTTARTRVVHDIVTNRITYYLSSGRVRNTAYGGYQHGGSPPADTPFVAGEAGEEIISGVPPGSFVHSAAASSAELASQGGGPGLGRATAAAPAEPGVTVNLTVHGSILSERDLRSVIVDTLRTVGVDSYGLRGVS